MSKLAAIKNVCFFILLLPLVSYISLLALPISLIVLLYRSIKNRKVELD